MLDWTGVIDAEAGLLHAAGQTALADLPPAVALHSAHARMRLTLETEALDLARAILQRHPESRPARQFVARALTQMGDHAAALDLRRGLWAEGATAMLPHLAANLIALREFDACDALLAEAEQRSAPVADVAAARTDLLIARNRPTDALPLLQDLRGTLEEATQAALLARAAQAAADGAALQALLARLQSWLADPVDRPRVLAAGHHILNAHWSRLRDAGAVLPVLRRITEGRMTEAPLLPAAAVICARLLHQIAPGDAAANLLERTTEHFPCEPKAWSQWLSILARDGRTERCAAVRARLARAVPAAAALNIIAAAESDAWPIDDLPALIRHMMSQPPGHRQFTFFSMLRRLPVGPELAATILAEMEAHASTINVAQAEALLVRAADTRRLHEAVLTPTPFAGFRQARAGLARRLDARAAAIAADPRLAAEAPE